MTTEFSAEDLGSQNSYNDPIPPSSKMVGWVMKTGLVRDEKQANYVLLAISLVFIISAFAVIQQGTGSVQPTAPTLEQQRAIEMHRNQVKN